MRPKLRHVDVSIVASATLSLAGFALCAFAFWPGQMSIDSNAQYVQAVLRNYGDQHPPVMAWLWGWTDRMVRGPGGMLLLHLAWLWGGLFAVAEAARRRALRHSWAIILVGFLPTTLSILGVIWKDVGMACALVCAVGLTSLAASSTRRPRILLLIIAMLLIAYATMIRANAAAATLPVAWLCAGTAFRIKRWRRALGAGVGIVVVTLGVQQVVEHYGLEARREHLSQMIMLYDLAAIECAGGPASIPPHYRSAAYDAAAFCDHYQSTQVDALFFESASPLRVSGDEHEFSELRSAWLRTIVAEPIRYLRHHNRAFASLLGVRKASTTDRLLRQSYWELNPAEFPFEGNVVSRAIDATTDALAHAGPFSGIVWLVLAAVLLIRSRPLARAPRIEVALLASSILYFLPYYFLSLAPNWRFIYWSVLATAIAGVLIGLRALTARHRSQRGNGGAAQVSV